MPTYPTYKLGQICETTSGGTPNRKNDAYYGGSIPWVKSGELGKGTIYDTEEKITEEAVKESSAKIFPKGTLLIALYGATIGKLGFLGVPAATNQAVCGIFENEKIDLQFLSYYLFHKRNDLIAQGTGGAQPNISQSILKNLPIPLPPLPTQRAIVTRIETLFAELDKAVLHLRTAQQQLKTYRQAVLNHWLNNEDGKWETVELREVADVNTGSTPKRGNKEYWENGTIPWITSGETNNQYITKATEFITTKAVAETNCKIIAKGSLVIAMYGEGKTRGKCAELSIDATTNQALASITFTDSRMYKNFAKWFFEKNYEDMRMLSSGGVQPNLNLGIIKNMILPLPPLSEQQRIVNEIESRLSQATATETYIENALQQAEALRQSILKKAFSGELV